MYHARKWELVSGMLTVILTIFAAVVPVPQNGLWWRLIVIAIGAAACVALWRGISLQPIPRPHPLRVRVQRFICDLSKAKDRDNLGNRAEELRQEFQMEGIYPAPSLGFPQASSHLGREELNRAAICFKVMLEALPY
jgi:hypothetical protein